VHGLFASPLHGFVEMRGDSLVSGLSCLCLPQSFRYLACEAFLDFLILQVQKSYVFIYSGEFSTDYLDPRCQLIFDFHQFLGH